MNKSTLSVNHADRQKNIQIYDIIYEGCCIEELLEYDYECAECKYKWLGEEDE